MHTKFLHNDTDTYNDIDNFANALVQLWCWVTLNNKNNENINDIRFPPHSL